MSTPRCSVDSLVLTSLTLLVAAVALIRRLKSSRGSVILDRSGGAG